MFRPPLLRGRIEDSPIPVSPRLLSLGRCRGSIHRTCPRFVDIHRARRHGGFRNHRRPRAPSICCRSQTLRRGPFFRRLRAHALLRRAFFFEKKLWPWLQPGVRRPAWIRRFWYGYGFGNAGRMGIRRAWPFRPGSHAPLSPHPDFHYENDVSTLNFPSLNKEFSA